MLYMIFKLFSENQDLCQLKDYEKIKDIIVMNQQLHFLIKVKWQDAVYIRLAITLISAEFSNNPIRKYSLTPV